MATLTGTVFQRQHLVLEKPAEELVASLERICQEVDGSVPQFFACGNCNMLHVSTTETVGMTTHILPDKWKEKILQ